jgi:hypothetical protein
MSINDSSLIDVYNYTSGFIAVPSGPNSNEPRGYMFEPCVDGKPSYQQLTYTDVKMINGQSNLFKEGFLKFSPEDEKEIYGKLGIREWHEIMSDEDIRNIILNPSKEGLEKFISVRSPSLFERIRGMFIQLNNSRQYDISMRVSEVIEARYQEIYNNPTKISDIRITRTVDETVNRDELTKEIEAQVRAEIEAEYKKKLAEAKKELKKGKAIEEANNEE